MLVQLIIIQHLDIRRAVQQSAVRRRVEFDPQLALRARQSWSLRRVPEPLELIVTVERHAVVESGQHCFAACLHGVDNRTCKLLFVAGKLRQMKTDVLDNVAHEHARYAVGSASDFRPFRHRASP